ncbi:FitA-like ribbon-helix-helix domain-containing protein [Comamonas flocculans]|uniref:Pantothenate metabolism flavoprotein n=1 Tax=Comamonas flocculans TaxID=2597701 RepID=A0A5B8RYH7_9BURK|nr:pantothenate metabolism flavoprotein [Comamonas flocculans]QEA13255.1 pantothenate metabolism flavoprotein [Comamonas flocculans]
MSSITVRNLDESIKAGLRLRAARNGWSMEQEVRSILQKVVGADGQAQSMDFAQRIQQRFQGLDASGLPIAARRASRTPPAL